MDLKKDVEYNLGANSIYCNYVMKNFILYWANLLTNNECFFDLPSRSLI